MTELKWFKSKSKEESQEDFTEHSPVLNIPCDLIGPNRSQPRADFNNDALIKLSASIKRYGILQPLTVKKTNDSVYEYELIAGERRLRAARMLELYSVPCIVLHANDETSAELAIIENLMREGLNMFEMAYGLRNLCEDYGLTQDEVAKRMSMSQSAVANKIRLLRLTFDEQQAIMQYSLTERHARALLRLDDPQKRMAIIHNIAENELTVNETEEYVERVLRSQDQAEEAEVPEPKSTRRSANAIVRGIQKKLDAFASSGKNASMEIKSGANTIELKIIIEK